MIEQECVPILGEHGKIGVSLSTPVNVTNTVATTNLPTPHVESRYTTNDEVYHHGTTNTDEHHDMSSSCSINSHAHNQDHGTNFGSAVDSNLHQQIEELNQQHAEAKQKLMYLMQQQDLTSLRSSTGHPQRSAVGQVLQVSASEVRLYEMNYGNKIRVYDIRYDME